MKTLLLLTMLIGAPAGGQNILPNLAPLPNGQTNAAQAPAQNPAAPGQPVQLPAPKLLPGEAKNQPDQSGIVPQTQGPLHEAYAQPVDQNPTPGTVVPKAPPPPVPELPPGEKPEGANVQWIPGYWGWDPDKKDYLWISGLWRNLPPERKWVAGYWNKAGDGWQWTSGYWGDGKQAKPQYLPEPPDSLEQGPSQPAPNENYFYIPGAWVLKDGQYVWRPGFWYPAQQDWVYVAPHYNYSPAGSIYIDGYWDYPLADRGTLYAPVVFNQPYWNDPGWYYQPSWGWGLGFGFGGPWNNLFIGSGFRHYYCGNYFGAGFYRNGFNPWYAYGARHYDPLFAYNHWNNRHNPGWYNGLHANYWNRAGNPGQRGFNGLGQNAALAGGRLNQAPGPQRLGNGTGAGRGNMFQMAAARQLQQPPIRRAANERGATPPRVASRPAGGPSNISAARAISGGSTRIFNAGGAGTGNLSRGAVASATANQSSFNANSRAFNAAAATSGSAGRAPVNYQSFYSGPSRTAPTPLYQARPQVGQNLNSGSISSAQSALNASLARQNQAALGANAMRQNQANLGAANAMRLNQANAGAANAMRLNQANVGAANAMRLNQANIGAANAMRQSQALSTGRAYSGAMGGGYPGSMGSRSGISGYTPSMSGNSGRAMAPSGYSGARMGVPSGGGARVGGGGGGGGRVGGGGGGGRGGGGGGRR